MTFGSLFSGCGGLDLGLELAGHRCVWQVENDPDARSILARHWPGIPRPDDVRTFVPEPAGDWAADLVVGGDPCQGNSKAGGVWKRPVEDLGVHFLRVVGSLRPRLVLRENPSESRGDAPWPWWRFRGGLERLGYAVLPFRLRACCLGADHRRERLFLLAELADAHRLGLAGLDRQGVAAGHGPGTARDRGGDFGGDGVSPSRLLRASDGLPRRLDFARLKALGNAVDVRVARHIGRLLAEAVR